MMLLLICIVKIYMLKKSIKEIDLSLKYILKSDTNNIISVSSADKNIKSLASNLNKELVDLRNQKIQYESGNQKLKNFINDISHDLRTPLTAIIGYVELLKEEKLNNKQEKYLKIINNKTTELTSLTEQLRDFSTGLDLELKKEECCINNILEETIASYYNLFKIKDIKPNINICKKKILKNVDLISNAIKYSDSDCNITLQEDGKILFINKASKLDVVTVKKIFDRYYTVENMKEFSGLGLSIAKELVELNGGTISAKYKNSCLIMEIQFD